MFLKRLDFQELGDDQECHQMREQFHVCMYVCIKIFSSRIFRRLASVSRFGRALEIVCLNIRMAGTVEILQVAQ